MATIGNLSVILTANANGLIKGLNEGKSALSGFAKAAGAVAAGNLLASGFTAGLQAIKDWTVGAFTTHTGYVRDFLDRRRQHA